jgi:serine/threonine protein kinase
MIGHTKWNIKFTTSFGEQTRTVACDVITCLSMSKLPKIILKNGGALIDGKLFALTSHELTKIIGFGANGVVFKANNKRLMRIEAVKLWVPRDGDRRDKVKQGLLETQRQAAASHPQVIKIFYADVINGKFYTTMEYFEGGSLKSWAGQADLILKWGAAFAYLQLIKETSKPDLYHGDPHAGNVLIDEYGQLALCDYGTSYYSNSEESWQRHWRIVDEGMKLLLAGFATFDLCRAEKQS